MFFGNPILEWLPVPILMIVGPFWDPLRDQFGVILGIIFFVFYVFYEVAFGGPWPPFGLPKHLQNEPQEEVKIKT